MVVIAKRQNQRHPESIEGSHFTLTDSELPVDIPIPRWEWRRCALGVDELLQLGFRINDTTECGDGKCPHISCHVLPLMNRSFLSTDVLSTAVMSRKQGDRNTSRKTTSSGLRTHTHRGCSQELARLEEGRQRALIHKA